MRKRKKGRHKPKELKRSWEIDPRVHPVVKALFEEINKQKLTSTFVANEAGISRSSLVLWAHGTRSPHIEKFEAVLNVLGFTLLVGPKKNGKV